MTLKKSTLIATLSLVFAAPLTHALTTPAAPATVDTNAEKAIWEALMSPIGEYAAYASYQAILNKYGQVEPYATILRSEQAHINALARQLQRYGVMVPANPYLGKVPVPVNLKLAAQEEANVEVQNAAMYDRLFALVAGDPMLTRVFTNLRNASQDVHRPLFNLAAQQGGTLSAAQMTAWHTQNMNANAFQGRLGQGRGYMQNGLQASNQYGQPGMGMRAGQPGRGQGMRGGWWR